MIKYDCPLSESQTHDQCICLLSTEDVHHMMFECSHLAEFNDFMKNVLLDICAKSTSGLVNQLDFGKICKFGVLKSDRYINFYFLNNISAIRKLCVVKRRNIAIKENKILNIDEYFKTIVIRNVRYAYEYYKNRQCLQLFGKYYSGNNPIITVQESQVHVNG